MGTEEEIVADYRSSLSELETNHKPTINMLTMLAEENVEFASAVVKVVESHIQQVPALKKLPALYLIDSIIKNCAKTKYKDLFARGIVNTFLNVFQSGDEKVRLCMYKLRQTWTNVFPQSKLYGIDIKTNAVDPQWPVVSQHIQRNDSDTVSSSSPSPVKQTQANQQIHVNPRFLKSQTSETLTEDEKKLQKLQQQREEMAKQENERSKVKPQSVVTVPRDPRRVAKERLKPTEPDQDGNRKKKRPSDPIETKRDRAGESGVTTTTTRKGRKELLTRYQEESANRNEVSTKKHKRQRNYRPREDNELTGKILTTDDDQLSAISADSIDDEPAYHEGSPSEVAVGPKERAHDVDLRTEKRLPPKKRRTLESETSSKEESHSDGEPKEKKMKDKKVEENSNKEHRLPQPDTRQKGYYYQNDYRRQPNRRFPGHNRDPRIRNERPPADPTSHLGNHAFDVTDPRHQSGLLPTPLVRLRPYRYNHPPRDPFFGPPILPPPPPPPPENLDPIPANNRIFVDGNAYEVHYIEDIPVIERNGLPHKIYFTGPPRNVVVDGVSHSLAFGDSKNISIDGQMHSIRFGAPSRELYMGSYPFRGAFGGPPIFATINSIRHEIRLGGPPPEVKIEPEPCYELQHLLHKTQVPRGPVYDYGSVTSEGIKQPEPQTANSSTVAFLLDNLVKIGMPEILNKLTAGGVGSSTGTPSHDAGRSPARPATPPIPCGVDDEVVPRDQHPPPNIKDFSMRALKVRYQAVIESLYQTKQRCHNCGLRFDNLDPVKYARHLDWHFKENRKSQDPSRGLSRPWYFAVEDWINYSEQGDDPASKAKSAVFENSQDSQKEEGGGSSQFSAASAGAHEQNCEVCVERFESFWDEEEEEWKLRNAIVIDGKVFHPVCYQDISVANPETPVSDTSAFLISDSGATYSGALPGLDVSVEEPKEIKEEEESPIAMKQEPLDNSFITEHCDDTTTVLSTNDDDATVILSSSLSPQGVNNESYDLVRVKQEPLPDGGFDSVSASLSVGSPSVELPPDDPEPRSPGTPVRDDFPLESPGTPVRDEIED